MGGTSPSLGQVLQTHPSLRHPHPLLPRLEVGFKDLEILPSSMHRVPFQAQSEALGREKAYDSPYPWLSLQVTF